MDLGTRIDQATEVLQSKISKKPSIGLILGSGLGDYALTLENPVFVNYNELPGFPVSTVEGHAGRFVIGDKSGKTIIAMQGRFHYYEGYSQQELTMPVRVMKKLGVETVVITNAAGGVNTSFENGTLMLIQDHINFSGSNPLMGKNLSEFGPRFPDATFIYTPALRKEIKALTEAEGIALREGVYMMFSGPNYETPAEVRMARTLGADAVGMSTVPEALVAAHCGLKVLGISCITNMAAGVTEEALCHEDVIATTERVRADFIRVLDIAIDKLL